MKIKEYLRVLARIAIYLCVLTLLAACIFGLSPIVLCLPIAGGVTAVAIATGMLLTDFFNNKKLKLSKIEALGSHQVRVFSSTLSYDEIIEKVLFKLSEIKTCRLQHLTTDDNMSILKATTDPVWFLPGTIIVITVSKQDDTYNTLTISSKPNHKFNFLDSGRSIQIVRSVSDSIIAELDVC